MEKWYARPVFFVADMDAALSFYVDRLGFARAWGYDEDGRAVVVQVARGDCEVILCCDAARAGTARLYVSLEAEERATFDREIEEKSIETTRGWWGSPVLTIRDPDGNELLFALEDE